MKKITSVLAFALAVSPALARAGGVEEIAIDDFDDFAEGRLEGALLRARGELGVGHRFDRLAIEGAFTAYSVARSDDGRVFVGTGPEGRIDTLSGDRLVAFAETGQLLVASLAFGPDGTLYAGTLPEGRVFAIDGGGEVRELVRLEGADHVWSLVYHPGRGALIAATGPEGRLFSIDSAGNARVLLDSEASHILSLGVDGDGAILAGTDGPALLYRIGGDDEARVLHDFAGDEVRAIAARADGVYVAANEMPDPPSRPSKPEGPAPLSSKLGGAKPGKGRLYRLGRDGLVERLLSRKDGHFTALSFEPGSDLLIGQAGGGRLFRLEARDRVGVAADLEDEQILALDASRSPLVLVTGNGAALHREGGRGGPPAYVSKVFDTGSGARLGRVTFRGEGAIRIQTRTGPREEPDASWSEWSTPIATPGPARSPADRFVQLRALFPERGEAVLRSLSLHYLPANRRARVSNVRAVPDEKAEAPSPNVSLAWDVDRPDDDELRFRLTFREESQSIERPLLRDGVTLTKSETVWDTSGVPDGHYVVTVEASDERDNPPSRTRVHREESKPIRVDNQPPRFTSLEVKGTRVVGRVVDAMGPIARLEVAVDGGRYEPRLPTDGILDGPEESFDFDLRSLGPGEHIVTVRAADAAHNSARSEVIVRTRGPERRR